MIKKYWSYGNKYIKPNENKLPKLMAKKFKGNDIKWNCEWLKPKDIFWRFEKLKGYYIREIKC